MDFYSLPLHPYCPSICFVIVPSLPISAVILEVVVRLTWARVRRVKAKGAQFQLSEADPLLVMALRGLRDTEPLFFQ